MSCGSLSPRDDADRIAPGALLGSRHAVAPNPWLVLVLVCLAQFMVVLDATIVNVALPTIQQDLDMSDTDLQWIVNAYTLMFGGFLLLGGRAGDLIGRKKVFLAGRRRSSPSHRFSCALAPGATWLIMTRGLQGLGAALVSPAALSIVTATFKEGADRTKALGVWAAIAVGGGAVGLAARRHPRRDALVAVDLPRQRPGRHRRLRPLAALRARVARRARAQELRHRRRGDRHGRADRARLRDRALGRVGLGLG